MTHETLRSIISGNFAILTANEPRHASISGGNAALYGDIVTLGRKVIRCEGMYEGQSDGESYLVPGMHPRVATALGRAYGQNEVITRYGSVECHTGRTAPWTGGVFYGAKALTQPFYSITRPGDLAFTLDIDWDARQ
jgi:hypothetical protein